MIYIFILIIILFIRYYLLKTATAVAVDQWFCLNYRDGVIQQKKCPPKLPQYLLDVKQWYPPLFGYFLSIVPNTLFKKINIITQVLSLVRLSIIGFLAFMLHDSFSFEVFISILIYITAPILVYYDNQINSRVFGAIVLDVIIILFWFYFEYNLIILYIPIIIFTIILLFTHKMSHQLYLFIILGLSIYFSSVLPVLSYFFANLIAFIFCDYSKYFKAHLEIVN